MVVHGKYLPLQISSTGSPPQQARAFKPVGLLVFCPQIMGSTGPNFVCPWCGRKNTSGYALDGINYPICSGETEFSCLSLALQGISKNGVRAGALYHILGQCETIRRIHGVHPNFFLELCDFTYGTHEEYHTQMERLQLWNNRYCLPCGFVSEHA